MESIELTVMADEVDLATGLLWLGGVSGIEERSAGDGSVRLIAGVEPAEVPAVVEALAGRWSLRHGLIDAAAHLDDWRAWARAVRVGERLVIQPPWVTPIARPGDLVVTVDPGHAWGHGAHPTTTLVVGVLLDLPLVGCSVLDVGCGGGVLSVVAAVLGAARVVAIDIDPAAVDATGANAMANGVDSIVDASSTSLADVSGAFDVVVANIGCAVLCEQAAALVARAGTDATVVLSGLLDEQDDAVSRAYASLGWRVADRVSLEGWTAITLRACAERRHAPLRQHP